MKKALILVLMSALILTSCGGKSIGIIGGADGPTAILISEENQNIAPVRMMCIDGDYYYDTGVWDDTPRCGTLDGSLEKTAEIFYVPKGEKSANFEGKSEYFGYQSSTSITKDVPIDGKWMVFRKVEDYGEDLSRYKYCYKVSGRHPNAAIDSEYLVMTNEENVTFEMITKYFFSSQLEDHQLDAHIVSVRINDEWGLTMQCADVTPAGMTVKFEQLGGNYDGRLETGDWYKLEKYADGKWADAETVISMENVGWHQVAYSIPKNEISEFEIDWKWLYGQLSPGTYRISKEVMDFKGTGDFEEKIYDMQFVIE